MIQIAKFFLNILAFFLKKSKASVYYLVKTALKDEIKEASGFAFATQHIENAIVLAKLQKNQEGIILDVGGGAASTALQFSGSFPNTPVYVFEPIKSSFENIKSQKLPAWILVNKAVGNEIGESVIHIADRVTSSSLLKLNDKTDAYGDSLVLKGTEKIQVTTLDAEIPAGTPVLILKLDVQGFELEALKGAASTLKRTQIVVLEINNYDGFEGSPTYFELDDYLRSYNFSLYDIIPSKRHEGKLLDWDAIYLNMGLK